MNTFGVRLLSVLILLVPLATVVRAEDKDVNLDRLFPNSEIKIATPDARLHRFHVWVAEDEARRERGLMFVKHMPANAGMLFAYPAPRLVSMWMKNTVLPLDMLFVNSTGKIEKVVENTKPFSLDTINSDVPVIAVIELNTGTCARLHIRAGARVIHEFFASKTE